MKRFLVLLILCPLFATSQVNTPRGIYDGDLNYYASGSDTLRPNDMFYVRNDSVKVHYLQRQKLGKGKYATYALGTNGLYYPLDSAANHGSATDTLITSTGYKVWVGSDIKFGLGTSDDGGYKYIRVSTSSAYYILTYKSGSTQNDRNAEYKMPAQYAGATFRVKRFVYRYGGAKYPIVVPKDGAGIPYEVDIESAIKTGEVDVPERYRPAQRGSAIIKQQSTPADELLKYKKLLDMGAINQQEYDEQKQKLLSK